MTQEQLAEQTGYSVDFIGLVERGVNAPSVERLQDIADALRVEVWQLFKEDGDAVRHSRRSTSKRKSRQSTK
jgi:transcriptional regulator with XRE-family HTH domain